MSNYTEQQIASLLEKNMGIIVKLGKSFKFDRETYEDILQVGRLAAWRAIKNHDPNKAKLSTVIYTYVRNDMIRFAKKQWKHKNKEVLFPRLFAGEYQYQDNLWEYMPSSLNENEHKIVHHLYEGHSFREIGKNMGLTTKETKDIFANAAEKIRVANE